MLHVFIVKSFVWWIEAQNVCRGLIRHRVGVCAGFFIRDTKMDSLRSSRTTTLHEHAVKTIRLRKDFECVLQRLRVWMCTAKTLNVYCKGFESVLQRLWICTARTLNVYCKDFECVLQWIWICTAKTLILYCKDFECDCVLQRLWMCVAMTLNMLLMNWTCTTKTLDMYCKDFECVLQRLWMCY